MSGADCLADDDSDNLAPYYDRTEWKEDEAEVARRVWEWWKVHAKELPNLAICVRLVVLVQVSSASVERVFSQLKYIVDTCQQNTLHDALLLRLFSRVNKDYYKR